MNQIIQKARDVLQMCGETYHSEFLSIESELASQSKKVSDVLTDEEFNVLIYFTAIGSGTLYGLAKEKASQELSDFMNYFDSILRKIPIEKQKVVYRMDTFEKYLEVEDYISRYRNYMSRGLYIKVPWALSVSLDNWNKDCPDNPIWEIELLSTETKAHSIYPLLAKH